MLISDTFLMMAQHRPGCDTALIQSHATSRMGTGLRYIRYQIENSGSAYSKKTKKHNLSAVLSLNHLVAGVGFEPTVFGF